MLHSIILWRRLMLNCRSVRLIASLSFRALVYRSYRLIVPRSITSTRIIWLRTDPPLATLAATFHRTAHTGCHHARTLWCRGHGDSCHAHLRTSSLRVCTKSPAPLLESRPMAVPLFESRSWAVPLWGIPRRAESQSAGTPERGKSRGRTCSL